ncbi:MAG: 5-methyltetrahydropteroyltriglutamate--homocysteine methyltransferase [Dehalococcoidia bacterium]|nr:MAG: 5-methyltetrahydropteroyltriglutamate--homocysteine methyltransferase [Dehalococcoidia bacterium]
MLPPLTGMLVGSYPQPDWLVEPTGAMPPLRFRLVGDAFAEGVRRAREAAVRDQIEAGLGVIGDGEQDRVSYQHYFLQGMTGLDTSPHAVGPPAPVQVSPPRVVGPLALAEPLAVQAVAPLRALTDRPIKLTVVGPFTLSFRIVDDYYRDRARFGAALADVINGELRALQDAGCDIVQIDEPALTARPHDPETIHWGLSLVDRALAGITVPVVMHLCFGYALVVREKSAARAETTYHTILPLLRDARPDILSLELEQPNVDLSVLARCPGKQFLLGLLDLSREAIEAPEQIAGRIHEAARHVPLESLLIGPDCGMKFLPRSVAKAKLAALTAAAALVRP